MYNLSHMYNKQIRCYGKYLQDDRPSKFFYRLKYEYELATTMFVNNTIKIIKLTLNLLY